MGMKKSSPVVEYAANGPSAASETSASSPVATRNE